MQQFATLVRLSRPAHAPRAGIGDAKVFLQRSAVRKIAGDTGSDSSHGRFRRRVKKPESQTKRVARKSQHITKLPAAEDPAQSVEIPGLGQVSGDVAWSGNWFFLPPGNSARQQIVELIRCEAAQTRLFGNRSCSKNTHHDRSIYSAPSPGADLASAIPA